MGLFSEIPRHNQFEILKKLKFKDFVKFKQCSLETVEITKNFKHRLPLKLGALSCTDGDYTIYPSDNDDNGNYCDFLVGEPVRVHFELYEAYGPLSKESVDWLEDYSRKVHFTVSRMLIDQVDYVECDSSIVADLLKIVKVTELDINGISNFDFKRFVSIPGTEKLESMSFYDGEMKESDLLHIKTASLSLTHVEFEVSDIPKFLKQWLNGGREIEHLYIYPLQIDVPVLLEGIKMDVLWTPESHESSVFALFERPKANQKMVISLTRKDGKKLKVELYEDAIIAGEYEHLEEIQKYWKKLGS